MSIDSRITTLMPDTTIQTRLVGLTTDHQVNPIALARKTPAFSWRVESPSLVGLRQTHYRIHVSRQGDTIADTGRVFSDACTAIEIAAFTGEPGVDYVWRLEVWFNLLESPLEASAHFGIAHTQWRAPWIVPQQSPVTVDGASKMARDEIEATYGPASERLHPPRLLRHEFQLADKPVRARLRITSQGVHQPYLNGDEVSPDLLAPGYESYHLATSVVTHDITGLLQSGKNVLGIVLGDGWYAGRISLLGRSAQYGDTLSASWEIECLAEDGSKSILIPDGSVLSGRGPIDYSDIFIGERYDAREEAPGWSLPTGTVQGWTPCSTRQVTEHLQPFTGEPVRRTEVLPVKDVLVTPQGDTIIDFGQVIAGRVRLRVHGEAGTVVRLEHSEVIDAEGNFLNNIVGPNKDQVDEYVLKGAAEAEVWEPLFSFHGFRYVRVSGYPGTPTKDDFEAIVIGSDIEQTAEFRCSDERLTKLFENTMWSQRGNFLAVPTDCPQRERAGWTGDVQIYIPAAATLMNVAAFMERWLRNVRADQVTHDGGVPNIVPMPPAMFQQSHAWIPNISAGWGDVITIAPVELYKRTGDIRFLRDNLTAMRDWVAYQTRQAEAALPERISGQDLTDEAANDHRLMWNGDRGFGDWLAPSTLFDQKENPFQAIGRAPKLTGEIIGPMFQVKSLDLLADVEEAVGDPDLARKHRQDSTRIREAFVRQYLGEDGSLPGDLQGIYVLALAFDMVPQERQNQLLAHLLRLIAKADMHLDTGFLSVAHLLDVLWDNGKHDIARSLLLQNTPPSWLYEVEQGATTIWETWLAIHPDGSVEETSMNHYAFGCVVDWMMRRIAGIDPSSPGYRTLSISPDLDSTIDWCSAHIDTPLGRVAVDWARHHNTTATLNVKVPVGASARVEIPAGWSTADETSLESGSHRLSLHRTADSETGPR